MKSDPERLMEALGTIVYEWSRIEAYSAFLVRNLLNRHKLPPHVAFEMTGGVPLQTLWRQAETLFLGTSGHERFMAWTRTAKELQGRRNKAVHSLWTSTPGVEGYAGHDVTKSRKLPTGPGDHVNFSDPEAELQDLVNALREASSELGVIVKAAVSQLDSNGDLLPIDL